MLGLQAQPSAQTYLGKLAELLPEWFPLAEGAERWRGQRSQALEPASASRFRAHSLQ